MTGKQRKELEELYKPLAEYLERNHDPYTEIHVSMDAVKLMVVHQGIPLNKNGD